MTERVSSFSQIMMADCKIVLLFFHIASDAFFNIIK